MGWVVLPPPPRKPSPTAVRYNIKTPFTSDVYPRPLDPMVTDWEEWFAWRPVKTLSGDWIWLKSIYRRMWWLWLRPQTYGMEYGRLFEVVSGR